MSKSCFIFLRMKETGSSKSKKEQLHEEIHTFHGEWQSLGLRDQTQDPDALHLKLSFAINQ